MKNKALVMVFAAFMALSMTACGGGDTPPAAPQGDAAQQGAAADTTPEPEVVEPPDLTGEWTQANKSDDPEATYQIATISGETMEIYWMTNSDDTKALYWAGTFTAPTAADEPYTWDSQNDKEQTDTAIMASGDDTKTFTYADGQISYEVSAMGMTTTVKLEKQG